MSGQSWDWVASVTRHYKHPVTPVLWGRGQGGRRRRDREGGAARVPRAKWRRVHTGSGSLEGL
jgi:hypothetical protein